MIIQDKTQDTAGNNLGLFHIHGSVLPNEEFTLAPNDKDCFQQLSVFQ